MTKEKFILSGLLELFATGISSPEETEIVEGFLIQFPELKDELIKIEMSLESYAQAQAIEPPSSVKQKLLNEIFTSTSIKVNEAAPVIDITKQKRNIPMFIKLLIAASIILLIGSFIFNYVYYHKYLNTSQELQVAQQKMEQQSKSNEAMSADLNVITNKYAQPVVLKGTPRAPDALAKIFWLKNTGQVYIDPSNLPKAPEGKQYQLWAIVDGKPVNGGMIQTEKGIYQIQKMKSFGKAEAFAITLEKAGGSPVPTMDEMFVIAKM
ncbi:MAG: anti-sigma factor [Ginsengibacter sp.]